MDITISTLSPLDIDRVDELMKANSKTLGFLPRVVLLEHLGRGSVLGATADGGRLAGYLLYASYTDRFRIAHLCVAQAFRRQGLAQRLFEELKALQTTQSVVRLNCRRDYAAHRLWPRLGFIPVDEKPGRSLDGHLLTSWEYRLKDDSQLDLFRENASDQALDVVIDAHILFHFDEPMSLETEPSKALLADFLADLIHIHVADEVFVEVDRQENEAIRRKSRGLAHSYSRIKYDEYVAESVEQQLRALLRTRTDSDNSDIKHLAQTAASDVGMFVTRDGKILNHSDAIELLTHVEVVSPVDLILRLHELRENSSYKRTAVSGQDLAWRRARVDDPGKLVDALLQPGESKRKLKQTLNRYLSRPDAIAIEILAAGEEILGARAIGRENGYMYMPFVRAVRSSHQQLVQTFLVSDALTRCVAESVRAMRLKGDGLPKGIEQDLLEMGFLKVGSDYDRLCVAGVMSRVELDRIAAGLFPRSFGAWSDLANNEILSKCSPIAFRDETEACFIVPIKPSFAMSLFDKRSASEDFFGWRDKTLMRWNNVYYRTKTHHHILKAPARVLWYESGKVGAITACSQLRSVEIGTPKALFRKFQKYGTLDWKDLFEMCKGVLTREIMALEFCHTFPFNRHVTLHDLRTIEGRQVVPLQSPREIRRPEFHQILEMGFSGAST